MILWRISNYANLEGLGELRASGRWHTRGRRIVSLATSAAAALLEILVHLELDPDDLPDTCQLLQIGVEDGVAITEVAVFPFSEDGPHDQETTRAMGDQWLSTAPTAFLQVPSVVVPETQHWLLNPNHPDAAKVSVLSAHSYPYEPRLFTLPLTTPTVAEDRLGCDFRWVAFELCAFKLWRGIPNARLSPKRNARTTLLLM